MLSRHKIYSVSFAKIYPCYVNKIEKKKRTVAELHQVIAWLTGYYDDQLLQQLMSGASIQGAKYGFSMKSRQTGAALVQRGDKKVVGIVLGAISIAALNRSMNAILDDAFAKDL